MNGILKIKREITYKVKVNVYFKEHIDYVINFKKEFVQKKRKIYSLFRIKKKSIRVFK